MIEKCLATLTEIAAKLQSMHDSSLDERFESIKSCVSNGFRRTDLLACVGSLETVEKAAAEGHASTIIYFVDSNEVRHRAEFRLDETTDAWKLDSLAFECPICFGEGLNDGERCDVCNGVGWGAR